MCKLTYYLEWNIISDYRLYKLSECYHMYTTEVSKTNCPNVLHIVYDIYVLYVYNVLIFMSHDIIFWVIIKLLLQTLLLQVCANSLYYSKELHDIVSIIWLIDLWSAPDIWNHHKSAILLVVCLVRPHNHDTTSQPLCTISASGIRHHNMPHTPPCKGMWGLVAYPDSRQDMPYGSRQTTTTPTRKQYMPSLDIKPYC